MSSIAVTIHILFGSEQSPCKICNLLNSRASRSGVYKVVKHLKEAGSPLPKVRSIPSRKVRMPMIIKNTREKIRRNSRRSVRKLASASGVSYGTMQTVLKNDLNLSPYKITKAQLLSQATKTKRLQRAKLFLEARNSRFCEQMRSYSLSRQFTILKNNRNYAVNKSDIPLNDRLMIRRQKPASVMVCAGVTSTGEKTPLIFIEEGVKLNQHVYLDLLKNKLVPWINATFGKSEIILQQDGVTSRPGVVQESCKRNLTGFWRKELQPPSSPDLNPMDFAIQSIPENKSLLFKSLKYGGSEEQVEGLLEQNFRRNCACFMQSKFLTE